MLVSAQKGEKLIVPTDSVLVSTSDSLKHSPPLSISPAFLFLSKQNFTLRSCSIWRRCALLSAAELSKARISITSGMSGVSTGRCFSKISQALSQSPAQDRVSTQTSAAGGGSAPTTTSVPSTRPRTVKNGLAPRVVLAIHFSAVRRRSGAGGATRLVARPCRVLPAGETGNAAPGPTRQRLGFARERAQTTRNLVAARRGEPHELCSPQHARGRRGQSPVRHGNERLGGVVAMSSQTRHQSRIY